MNKIWVGGGPLHSIDLVISYIQLIDACLYERQHSIFFFL